MPEAVKILAAEDVEALLKDWKRLNDVLPGLHIDAVKELLTEANVRGVRWLVQERIYQRYSFLRRYREKAGLREGILPWQIDTSL